MVPNLTWRCHGHTLALRVIELGPYDAILGYDYIKTHSLMDRHWANKTITFQEKGTVITLQGLSTPPSQVSAILPYQLLKWIKGNDVWAFAMLDQITAC